jgi:lysophospholipase L1-like esterase
MIRIFITLLAALALAAPAGAAVTTTTSSVEYTCNGSTTAFAVPFRFLEAGHLVVKRTATSTGAETTLILTTDYTVAGAGAASGTVATTGASSPCASGNTLSIERVVPLTQPTSFRSQRDFSPATHENAFDRLTMGVQQIDRFVRVLPAAGAAEAASSAAMAAGFAAAASSDRTAAQAARTVAETARTGAEGARDAANATGKVYVDTTAGLAAGAEGEYFTVPATGSSESLVLYREESGVAVEKKRYPTADAALKPNWTGRLNGWPDPFFRTFDLSAQTLFMRDRWGWNGTGSGEFDGWSRVVNPVFDGYALRRAADKGSTPLNGPLIQLDEISAAGGDIVTAYVLAVGDGALVHCAARFDSGADTGKYVDVQMNALSVTGAINFTASASPQWLRLSTTVPAGATRLQLWPYTGTAGKAFDVVAVWAFKGGTAAGPDWPSLERVKDADIARVWSHEAQSGYATQAAGRVSAASESIVVPVSSPKFSSAWGDPFSGWGERYTPAGISFNAVRMFTVARGTVSKKWHTLNVVVRTGANSHSSTGTVIAVGSTRVPPDSAQLRDITIVLKDPATGAVKTLTDADFAGGEYFVGVYARDVDGGNAGMGPPLVETAPATGLGAYYLTTGVGSSATWAAGAEALGFQHLLLTGISESLTYTPSAGLATDIGGAPPLVLPPVVQFTQGREVSIYFDNIIPAADADDFAWDVSGSSAGKHQNERWMYSPTGALAAATLTIGAYDKRSGVLVASGTTSISAVASSAGTGITLKAIFVGDSITDYGGYTGELPVIAASDPMKITLYGTRGSGANKHEGHAGWKLVDFIQTGSPFWIGGVVDFPGYLAANSIPVPDWVHIMAGVNDVSAALSDVEAQTIARTAFDKLDTLVASIKAAGASVRVALMTAPLVSSDQDAFGDDYGTGVTRWRVKRNVLMWNRELIARYSGKTADRVYIVPTHVNLDTVNNMSRASSAAVNSRSAVTSQRQNDALHPATAGYHQIADTVWSFLKANAP